MSNSARVNNTYLDINNYPDPPNIGYYDQDTTDKINSSSTLRQNLSQSCSNLTSDGVFNEGVSEVYNKTIDGTLDDNMDVTTNANNTKNQIRYLSCQLAASRNRLYESSKLSMFDPGMSVSKIFETFSNLKPYLILIFLLTFYFLISGFFSSFDVGANLINLVENNYSRSYVYWIALLVGCAVPVILLATLFVTTVCNSLAEQEKYNITDSPTGVKDTIPSGFQRLDTGILVLFLIFIYGFVVVIFTVQRESLGNTLYILIIGLMLLAISIFIFLFYTFIPFFATANIDNVDDFKQDLKLYVEEQQNASEITTNQTQIQNIQSVFGTTALFVFVFFIIYMIANKNSNNSESMWKDIKNGFFGASVILILPIVWIFNLILATKYFYIYPIILLGFRFVRYFGMLTLYILQNKAEIFKDSMTTSLSDQLENIREYSPTWNLLGVDLIKTIMNLLGYENIFSQEYSNNNNTSPNMSSNRYVTPGILSYAGFTITGDSTEKDFSNFWLQLAIFILTLIVSIVLLKGIYKVI